MNIFTAIALLAFLSCCLEVCGCPYRSGQEQLEYAASAKGLTVFYGLFNIYPNRSVALSKSLFTQ